MKDAALKADVLGWLADARTATLSTLVDGFPFGSVVPFALENGERPVLFLSELAVHTKALRADPRCSLLVSDPRAADPQQSWRVTLLGRARVAPDAEAAFLARHPETQRLPGFSAWVIDVERARPIEGFGRMAWIQPWHAGS